MTLVVSTLAGALLGALLSLVVPSHDGRGAFAAVGGVGALLAAIVLSGLMLNPPFASGALSPAAVGRSLCGAAFLLALFLLLQPRRARLRRRSAHPRTNPARPGAARRP